MSRGGQNRKTKQQAELDGTYRPDRHVAPLEVAPGDVVVPGGLAARPIELWNEYVAPRLGLGVYEPAEALLLAQWCNVYARLERVNAVTPFEGIVEIEDDFGRTQWVKHPGMSVFKALSEEFRALSARLGMDPLSRLALGDLQRERDGVGPSLPDDAPPAWKPTVLPGRAPRKLKPRCSVHARRWRKSCDECQRVRAREGLA